MKKLILVFFVLLSLSIGIAQNPDLYRTWYLTSYSYDLGDTFYIEDIQPRISPFLTIDPSMEFTGEAACNSYMGRFDYGTNDDKLILISFDTTLNLCDFQTHNDFENDYFGYFFTEANYIYSIDTDSDGNSCLMLSLAPGFDLVYQNFPLDISENTILKVKIYPNPVSDKLFIASEKTVIDKISVYSITGEKVLDEKIINGLIDVSSLSKGLYFLEIKTNQGKSIQKFIKK